MSRPTPLQNRCAPDGRLHATPERGLFMGNRGGRIHDDGQRLGTARWRSRSWIICRTDFRNRHRQVMGSGYTEIFFLDEATALAAGHRPCFECRRAAAQTFAAAAGPALRAPEIDVILHRERLGPRPTLRFAQIPDGAVFETDGHFHLKWHGRPALWSFAGYREPHPAIAAETPVRLLTPATTCAALAAGYRPEIHPSIG